MANLDDIKGICGDRTFMNSYYKYSKLKKQLREDEGENNSRENKERESCDYYLMAVSRCVWCINSLPDGDDKCNYLDWLRWNTGLIVAELERFEAIAHLQDFVLNISVCKKDIETVVQRYFQLAEDEKAVSNQYVHAYASTIRQANQSVKIYNRKLQHSGRLLINYVNYLKDRCYVHKLDRSETSIDQLQGEADYLMTRLTGVDDDLARNIKTVIEQYALFREADNAADVSQDVIMKYALQLAHIRYTENFLQPVIRSIQETISLIQQKTVEKLQKARATVDTARAVDAIKDGVEYVRSNGLLKSLKEIRKWARENPWKCATVVLSGIVIIGCSIGIGLSVGGAVIAIPVVGTVLTISGAAIGDYCDQAVDRRRNTSHIIATSTQETAIEKAKVAALINETEVEGRLIADEVKYDRIKRDYLKMADEQIRQEQREEATKRQFNSMESQQLNEAESQLRNDQEELQSEMRAIQSKEQLCQDQLQRTQRDMATVLEGRAASARIMAEYGKKSIAAKEEWDFM